MDLTTVARVRALRGFTSGETANDALLGVLVTSVSARAESYMGRHAEEKSRSETYEIGRGSKVVILRGTPIVSVASVEINEGALEAAAGFRTDAESGMLRILGVTSRDPNLVEITYVGGMAPTTTDLIARFPAVAGAVDVQVVHEFNRRQSPGGNIETRDASATFKTDDVAWLSGVKETLDLYSRGAGLISG